MSDFKADNFGHTLKESAKALKDKVPVEEVAGATVGGVTFGTLVGWGAIGVAGGLAVPATAVGVPIAATVAIGALAGTGVASIAKKVKPTKRRREQRQWMKDNYMK